MGNVIAGNEPARERRGAPARAPQIENDNPQPILFQTSEAADCTELLALRRHMPPRHVFDTVPEQLAELYFSRYPDARGLPDARERQAAFVAEYAPDSEHAVRIGSWVYFPWSERLVHYLPEALHTELRTARSPELIGSSEQQKLYQARIAIAGLNLGNAVASTIAISGIGRAMNLADADTLSASNLNRVHGNVAAVGMKKTSLTARELFEINPYAQLTLLSDGLNASNSEAFLTDPGQVSVVVDGLDDAYSKIELRRAAREHRIPVVAALDLHDNVFLAIERFDLEPQRPLFDGAFAEAELTAIKAGAPPQLFASFLQRWVGTELDAALVDSMSRVLAGRATRRPQLAPAAVAAGSAVSCALRRVLLGHEGARGRRLIAL